jgi:hypothetical protein
MCLKENDICSLLHDDKKKTQITRGAATDGLIELELSFLTLQKPTAFGCCANRTCVIASVPELFWFTMYYYCIKFCIFRKVFIVLMLGDFTEFVFN